MLITIGDMADTLRSMLDKNKIGFKEFQKYMIKLNEWIKMSRMN